MPRVDPSSSSETCVGSNPAAVIPGSGCLRLRDELTRNVFPCPTLIGKCLAYLVDTSQRRFVDTTTIGASTSVLCVVTKYTKPGCHSAFWRFVAVRGSWRLMRIWRFVAFPARSECVVLLGAFCAESQQEAMDPIHAHLLRDSNPQSSD